jgi:transcriptional regulator with GAF, ATPase, and Fis domain
VVTDPEHPPSEPSPPIAHADAGSASTPRARQEPVQADRFTVALTSLRRQLVNLERERVLKALKESGGNQRLAAQRLGMSRRSLVYRLTAFGLTRPRKREGSGFPPEK